MKELNSLFKDKNFIAFVLIVFIFYILFYEHIDYEIKQQIYKTLTNPIYIILIIGLIGFVLYYNFTIGIILALTLVISLTFKPHNEENTKLTKQNKKHNTIKQKLINKKRINEGFQNKSKKSFIEKSLEKLVNNFEDGINENKKLEKSLFKFKDTNNNESRKGDKPKNNTSSKNYSSLEISKRKFDLTNNDDKILVYSKEVLKDIVNRIDYEYDDREYLKKYIGSKFEEIIDLLGLLNDE